MININSIGNININPRNPLVGVSITFWQMNLIYAQFNLKMSKGLLDCPSILISL